MLEPAALAATLNVLEVSGLIHGQGSPLEATYTFKHALVQNAAYASLLRSQRQSLPARVAASMAAGMAEPATRSARGRRVGVDAFSLSGSKRLRHDLEVNAPGTTSSIALALLAEHGATECEPGHGLTGSTPLHAIEDLPERPAVCYVSEISHLHAGRAYCFGGGLYVDPVFPDYDVSVVVGHDLAAAHAPVRRVDIPPPAAIDYYGMIDASGAGAPEVGDTVVFGFRPQAFVTRAYTIGLSGLSTGQPRVHAIHDAFGRPANWPGA